MEIPDDVVLESLIKINVAGVVTTTPAGTTDPDAENTTPAVVPMVNGSQHPSVENAEKFTWIYPVGLFTIYLQFKLFA
jgi:hypothetical protein